MSLLKIKVMEKEVFRVDFSDGFQIGNWGVVCWGKRFKLNNNGIKLVAKEDEGLEKVVFDIDKKTVSVIIKTPTLSKEAPRIVDLSESVEFFEELRKNLEMVLTKIGTFSSVTPNSDRTIFEVSE